MKELDPQPRPGSIGPRPRVTRRRHESTACASLVGLRVVVAERNRRGAVARTMGSLRWLSLAGAEVLYGDLGSEDGSLEMVRTRFPFATAVSSVDARGEEVLRHLTCQPIPLREHPGEDPSEPAAPVRFVLFLSADLEVDRLGILDLLRDLAASPKGARVAMELVSHAGDPAPSSQSSTESSTEGSAWVIRRRDLAWAGPIVGEADPLPPIHSRATAVATR